MLMYFPLFTDNKISRVQFSKTAKNDPLSYYYRHGMRACVSICPAHLTMPLPPLHTPRPFLTLEHMEDEEEEEMDQTTINVGSAPTPVIVSVSRKKL